MAKRYEGWEAAQEGHALAAVPEQRAALEAHRITQHSAQRLPQEPRCADGSGHSMPQYALMTAVVTLSIVGIHFAYFLHDDIYLMAHLSATRSYWRVYR